MALATAEMFQLSFLAFPLTLREPELHYYREYLFVVLYVRVSEQEGRQTPGISQSLPKESRLHIFYYYRLKMCFL